MPPLHPLLEILDAACVALELSGRHILLGVSGGADSMALLRGLDALRSRHRFEISVAHLNHRLRLAAQADADWLRAECKTIDVPLVVAEIDVVSLARAAGAGIEETARAERYRFLEAAARDARCDAIAVAHTADDQAETILHHILRGTGLAGLRGMPRERTFESGTRLVRPLLDTRRSQVLDYLAVIGQDFRTDESNADETYTRNRLRQKLIPQLAAEYNPQVAEALRRLGQQAGEAQAAVEFAAGELLDGALDEELPRECRLKWQPLVAVPPHLVRELLTQLWRRQNWPRQSMTFEHWDALAMIVRTGGAATFPGPIDARREGKWVILKRTPG